MSRGMLKKSLMVAVALVVAATLAHAASAVILGDCLRFRGQWYNNLASTAIVKTRVENLASSGQVVNVLVQARGEDGSTVSGNANALVYGRSIREVAVTMPKRITSLTITTIRSQPNGQKVCCGGDGESEP